MADSDDDLFDDDKDDARSAAAMFGLMHLLDEEEVVPLTVNAVATAVAAAPTVLAFDRRGMGDAELTYLAGALDESKIASMSIKELSLEHNEFGDAGCAVFARTVRTGALANLERLSVCHNSVGAAGLRAISDSPLWPRHPSARLASPTIQS